MKFTDGQWVFKDGYQPIHPQQVFDYGYENDELVVYVYTRFVPERAQSIDQGTFTIHFTAPKEDIIKTDIYHHKGVQDHGPNFQLNNSNIKTSIEETDESICYIAGNMKVEINKNPFSIIYYHKGRILSSSQPKSIANIRIASDQSVFMREQLTLKVGEYIYGLGERFTPFVKNGQSVDMWNADGGTASDIAYKNIPFYISTENYGVLVNQPERVSYEIASENVERAQFSIPGESLSYCVIGGDNIKDVIERYTDLTGKPALPPIWSFGLWLSTSFTTNYDEETVTKFIDGMDERDIPLHVFHFDCFWMKEAEWCNFEWDKDVFSDPEAMLKRLKSKGLKICVWINPYIAQKSKLFDEAKEKGYLIKRTNGDVWQWDKWQAGMGIVDFTNPEACKWYQEKLNTLLEMGVDSFKTDFGERIPHEDVIYFDGSNPVKMHNYYTQLYNKTVFDLLEKVKGKNEAAVFARSATVGGQQFPVHWGGDCWGTYESMAESLRGGLSLGMSGFGFWSHDISGFEKTATADVYKRWVAFGLLSSHSRLHGSTSYRVPWVFDEEAVDVLRFYTNLKCSLMPYLWRNAIEANEKGYPMMRTMVMEFEDPVCRFLDTQYMLGDSLMVAPIFNPEGEATYYLPEGKWMNFITGENIKGGRYITEYHDYMSIPLMVRPNTLIPVGNNIEDVEYDYQKDVTIHLINLEEGSSAKTEIFNKEGIEVLEIKADYTDKTLTIQSNSTESSYTVLLRNIHSVEEVKDCSLEKTNEGIRLIPNKNANVFSAKY